MASLEAGHSIGVVERDTGIARDTLRVWERRYGFPVPQRNDKGERNYSETDLRRLQRIKRLMDQGMRPGKLLTLDEAGLNELEASISEPLNEAAIEFIEALLDETASQNAAQVQQLLQAQYQVQGAQSFIINTLAPLLVTVGDAWAAGTIQIYQEHFISQQLSQFLNAKISELQSAAKKPLVMITSLPGEKHHLGLLMLATILSDKGISVLNLGCELPLDQIANAVENFRPDIVGLTFSAAYPYNTIREHLHELRELLPDAVDIWAGGEGVARLRKLPGGVSKFTSLGKLPF